MTRLAAAVAGAPILAAWHNTNRDRTVTPFTNAAQRTADWPSPPDGAVSYLEDQPGIFWYFDNSVWTPTGSWVAYTPTLTQTGAVAKTTNIGKYVRTGKWVAAQAVLTATGSGTNGTAILAGLPVPAVFTVGNYVGVGQILDAGGAGRLQCHVELADANTVQFWTCHSVTPTGVVGVDPSMQLTSGDSVRFAINYEAVT